MKKVENLLMKSSNSTIMDFQKYPSSSSSSTTITKRAHSDDQAHQNEHGNNPEPLDCPRCGSKNTKFCYYNNYNKSQPRHFCKACKRHWTKGGMLRSVPVGGCRKNKRLKMSGDGHDKSIAAAAAVVVDTVAALNNSVMMYDQDCHDDLYLGEQEGLKAFNEDDKKSISSLLLIDAFMDNTFSFSGIDSLSFDVNGGGSGASGNQSSSISGIKQDNNVYYYDQCFNNSQLESLESSSTITTTNQYNDVCYPLWKSGGTVVAEEMADYWDLNDLDALISTDINVSSDVDDDGVINP